MAEISGQAVVTAVSALMLAGRWELAAEVLAATRTADPREFGALAMARAQVAVERRQWQGAEDPGPALDAAAQAVDRSGDQTAVFDLELLRLFADYWAEVQPAGNGLPRFGPESHDPAILEQLRERAERLLAAAPDQGRAARAAFYGGLIADNLRGEHERGGALFRQALNDCGPDDDLVAAEALRHLGHHTSEAGDGKLGRHQWERSAELAERAGWLPLALAQQMLLAELDRAEGDEAGARALAGEIRRWAGALGLGRLQSQAAGITTQA